MDEKMSFENKYSQIEEAAVKIISLARDIITVRFRFFDVAMAKLKLISKKEWEGISFSGNQIYYNPVFLIKKYMDEPGYVVRMYLHILLHNIFLHQYKADKLDKLYWNIAADIAVENIIIEFEIKEAGLSSDGAARDIIKTLKKRVPGLTAEKIYKDFIKNKPSDQLLKRYRDIFTLDNHFIWYEDKEMEMAISHTEWEKIARRIKTELAAFSENKTKSESLEQNIYEVTKDRYDYGEILRNFTVMGEEIVVNDDEFDYIYYTYGLKNYGNMPLIESLEYRENKKIKDFVIAIDTSASCKGEVVNSFLKKTYNILSETESFFTKINLHIIQCDAKVRQDTKITCRDDFEEFIEKGRLYGFGATDFRPVFNYVDELILNGEFDNLKGLIYFTDGYGIYPEKMPGYDVMFAFLNEDSERISVPGWAIKVILEDELNEY